VTLNDPRGTPVGATLKLRLDDGPRADGASSQSRQSASDGLLTSGQRAVHSAEVRWPGGEVEHLEGDAFAPGYEARCSTPSASWCRWRRIVEP
jgi:hypothetical protein